MLRKETRTSLLEVVRIYFFPSNTDYIAMFLSIGIRRGEGFFCIKSWLTWTALCVNFVNCYKVLASAFLGGELKWHRIRSDKARVFGYSRMLFVSLLEVKALCPARVPVWWRLSVRGACSARELPGARWAQLGAEPGIQGRGASAFLSRPTEALRKGRGTKTRLLHPSTAAFYCAEGVSWVLGNDLRDVTSAGSCKSWMLPLLSLAFSSALARHNSCNRTFKGFPLLWVQLLFYTRNQMRNNVWKASTSPP